LPGRKTMPIEMRAILGKKGAARTDSSRLFIRGPSSLYAFHTSHASWDFGFKVPVRQVGTPVFLLARKPRNSQCVAEPSTRCDLRGIIASQEPSPAVRQMINPSVDSTKVASTIFIGKWTLRILYALKKKPHRHGQLRRTLSSISQRMLTRTLRNLESAGLVARRVTTRSKSVAVEYSLTRAGKSFLTPLGSICHWADGQRKEISAVIRLR
jgi:DNA-binding HxlR family transcriptional regulator